jgi:hypothetical protein
VKIFAKSLTYKDKKMFVPLLAQVNCAKMGEQN